jgi:hypothetical protein
MTQHLGRTPKLLLALGLAVSLGACGTTAFSPHFRDNNPLDLKAAMTGMKAAPKAAPTNTSGTPLAFIVTTKPTKILAYDLSTNKVRWTVTADVTSRIVVGKTSLFHRQGKETLVARSIDSGQEIWTASIEGGDRLLGVTTDGKDVYYATERYKRSVTGEIGYLVGVNGASGATRWVKSSAGRLGAPAAHGGRVFVPLRFQSIAVVKSEDGQELARLRSKDETLLWARSSTSGVLFGGKNGVYRLDSKAVSGTQKESSFVSAALPKSVRPVYWWDGYNAALSDYTAFDRNRILWQVSQDTAPRFLDDTIYVHNYRFFFAFDTSKKDTKVSNLRWVYSFPRHDVVASTHTGKALLLITDNGNLIVLDPKVGLPIFKKELKVKVRGATFDTRGFTPSGGAKGENNLRESLSQVIWDPDRRFGAVKLFCVEEMARLPGGDIAADLVKIVNQESIDPTVYKRAGEVIVSRHDKKSIPLYLKTLKSHYNFIDGARGKAVDIMARALGDLKAPEAVKPLLAHLADHETPLPAVVAIIKALTAIGVRSVLEPFRDYLLTYRCDPMFTKAPTALNMIAEALLRMGGEEERQLLSFVQNDPHTLKSLRKYLGEALDQTKKGKPIPSAVADKGSKKAAGGAKGPKSGDKAAAPTAKKASTSNTGK